MRRMRLLPYVRVVLIFLLRFFFELLQLALNSTLETGIDGSALLILLTINIDGDTAVSLSMIVVILIIINTITNIINDDISNSINAAIVHCNHHLMIA